MCIQAKAGTTRFFTIGVFIIKKKTNHLRSNKIRFYLVLLHISCDYTTKGPMPLMVELSAKSIGIKPWFYSQKLGFWHENQKNKYIGWESWGFPTLDTSTPCTTSRNIRYLFAHIMDKNITIHMVRNMAEEVYDQNKTTAASFSPLPCNCATIPT